MLLGVIRTEVCVAGKGLHGQLKSKNAEFVFFLKVKRRQGLCLLRLIGS